MRLLAPTEENIRAAAEILRAGGLVSMPTETVYGLACDATNARAVLRVFEAKGRPADNPLIVHIASLDQLQDVASDVPESARVLAARFWPGPLTLVLRRSALIPSEATAGLDTVAVRMPSHPVALALIRAAGVPLAAPSANLYGRLSATRAEHLDPMLLDRIDAAIDGGPCPVGLESTVLDLTEDPPVILRPGHVSAKEIADAIGAEVETGGPSASRKSPGTHARHYAPSTPLRLVDRLAEEDAGLTFETPANPHQLQMPRDPTEYGARMYGALHELDALGLPELSVERPPNDERWRTVLDRLTRASRRSGS